MGAIVRASASLLAGNIAVIQQSIATTDDGSIDYSVEYCCLAQFSNKWTPFFRIRSSPPTPIPPALTQLNLTRIPALFNLDTETRNGLTYFRANYAAGISTDVIITEESDTRNFTVTTTRDVGFFVSVPFNMTGATTFVKTGEETTTSTVDYVSVTVTCESKNTNLPIIDGRSSAGTSKLLIRTSKRRDSRGQFTFSRSSSGITESFSTTGNRININERRRQ